LAYRHPKVNSFCLGEDKNWSLNIKKVITLLPTRYVLYLQEDYFFTAAVDTKKILDLFGLMKRRGAGYMRLCPRPQASCGLPGVDIAGIAEPGSAYRTSLQAAIWEKDLLGKLLVEGESAWDFEYAGSVRSSQLKDEFLVTSDKSPWPLPYFSTGIMQGKWARGGIALIRKENLTVYSLRRKHTVLSETWRDEAVPFLRRIKRRLLRLAGIKRT
jgi:hypothetical protein